MKIQDNIGRGHKNTVIASGSKSDRVAIYPWIATRSSSTRSRNDGLFKFFFLSLLLPLTLILLSGCANNRENEFADKQAEEIYTMAKEAMDKENYDRAAEIYDEVDRQHPYSELATKAQLMKGYAYYKEQKYPKALAAIETFIQLHPGHEDAAYAHYMRALCYYEQIFNVQRDQKTAEQAVRSFEEIINRYPDSKYARDAKMKMDLTLDHLAGKEMTIGRFYLNKDAHTAAANRFRIVIQNYQQTSHVPEALHRLVECYIALGLEDEALEAASVLGHNFSNSAWYADTYYLLKGVDLRHKDPTYLSKLEALLGVKLGE